MRNSTRIAATVASAGLIAAAMAAPASARQVAPSPTIVDVAVAVNADGAFKGQFDTLLAAATCDTLEGAIVNALSARGQRTLFAPTDDAFEAIGVTAADVCGLPASALADILTYHVTNGRRDASSVLSASSMRMLNGDRVVVDASNASLVDGRNRIAKIIATNVPASNGIIHAINGVLLPPV